MAVVALGRTDSSRDQEMWCCPGVQLTTVASLFQGPRRTEEAGLCPSPLPWHSHRQGSKGGGRAGSEH